MAQDENQEKISYNIIGDRLLRGVHIKRSMKNTEHARAAQLIHHRYTYIYYIIFQPLYCIADAHALDNNPFSSVISALGVLMTAGTPRTASYHAAIIIIVIIIICAQTSSACEISLFHAHPIFSEISVDGIHILRYWAVHQERAADTCTGKRALGARYYRRGSIIREHLRIIVGIGSIKISKNVIYAGKHLYVHLTQTQAELCSNII